MTIISNPIVRVTDFQSFLGEEVINVYHYRFASPIDPYVLDNLNSKFQLDIITPIAAAQSDALTHTRVLIEEVNRGTALSDETISIPGQVATSNTASSFMCASFILNRADRDTRSGRKAIAGLDESDFTGNVLSASGITKFSPLETVFPAIITVEGGSWAPIVLGKPDPNTTNGYFANRFTTSSLRTLVRTQTSRRESL